MSDFSNLSKKENKELDNYTTTELSILDKLDQNKNELILVDEWKQKLELLVSENPFVEIVDSKSYELAKQRKAIFRNARLELRNTGKTPSQESVLIGKINSIKDFVKTTIDDLVVIPSTPEEKQSEEVSRWEGIKEAEKAEKERLEKERTDTIQNKAKELEDSSLEIIQKMTYSGIVSDSAKVSKIMETEFDFEEFDILYTNAFSRVQSALEEKVKDLTQRENDRLETIRLQEENAEAKRKSDLQASRLQEILPYVAFGTSIDLTKLSEMDNDEYEGNLSSKKGLFEANQKIETERKEKEESDKKVNEEKVNQEKSTVFDIRKNRLIEIGFEFANTWFTIDHIKTGIVDTYSIDGGKVYHADVIEFENILSDAKKYIADFKEKEEKSKVQKEADEKASKADAAKLKAENKARIKRLADDKSWLYGELSKYFSIAPLEYLTENQETKDFIKSASERIDSLKAELLTELEKL